jgi:sugar phosphate isomerase/epimerase
MTPTIAIQLYTVRDYTSKDFAGTVKDIAKVGYKAVETAGFGNLDAAGAAKAIKDAGLKVSGMHVGMEMFTEKWDELQSTAKLLDTTYLIIPGVDPKRYASKEACLKFGGELNEVGAKARAAGFSLSYHNHDKEFAIYDGKPGLEWILDAAEPRNLSAQVDLFWVTVAGQNALRTVKRLGTRIRSLHAKDGTGPGAETPIGKGAVDFPGIFKFCRENGLADLFVVEQEAFTGDYRDACRSALEYLQGAAKA